MMRVRAVASTMLEEDQIEVIGFAEEPTGEGRSFIIQFPLQPEDEDDGYNLSTETGATYYGGLEHVSIDPASHSVMITLSAEASEVLGLTPILGFQIDATTAEELAFYAALQRLIAQEGIDITVSR